MGRTVGGWKYGGQNKDRKGGGWLEAVFVQAANKEEFESRSKE